MKKCIALMLACFVATTSCSDFDQDKTLEGFALVFRSGGIRLYPELTREAVVTVNAQRTVLPREILKEFDYRSGCVILIYRLKLQGRFDDRGFAVRRFVSVGRVDSAAKNKMIEALAIEALNDPRTCTTSGKPA